MSSRRLVKEIWETLRRNSYKKRPSRPVSYGSPNSPHRRPSAIIFLWRGIGVRVISWDARVCGLHCDSADYHFLDERVYDFWNPFITNPVYHVENK